MNFNWRKTEAEQWKLCSGTVISAVCLRCQVGTEEISVSLPEMDVEVSQAPTHKPLLSYILFAAYSAIDIGKKGRKTSKYLCGSYPPHPPPTSFGSYLLYLLLTLQFQQFNDTIVSANDTETDTHSHLIGCLDEAKSAVF